MKTFINNTAKQEALKAKKILLIITLIMGAIFLSGVAAFAVDPNLYKAELPRNEKTGLVEYSNY